jgi:4a-hydroxytetrahydrobiopterin dehydratase
VPQLTADEAKAWSSAVPDWELIDDGRKLRRRWITRDFKAGIDFIVKLAELAEREGHHPDIALEGYRNVLVVLWTHAIGGLSENDLILAAKIDELPIMLKRVPSR